MQGLYVAAQRRVQGARHKDQGQGHPMRHGHVAKEEDTVPPVFRCCKVAYVGWGFGVHPHQLPEVAQDLHEESCAGWRVGPR